MTEDALDMTVERYSLRSPDMTEDALDMTEELDSLRSLDMTETITCETDTYFVTNRFLGLWLMERYGVGFRF